jgi:hypothetical protein
VTVTGPVLPFEDAALGFWRRVGLTVQAAFLAPLDAYGSLARGRSLGAPWRLKLLFATPFYLGLVLGLGLLQLILMATAAASAQAAPRLALLAAPLALGALLALGPLLQGASMLLGGALLHALLWAFRGTRNGPGLRQTVRATGYTQALVGLLCLAPVAGILAWPAGKAALGLGLARLHRTEPWRGLAAVLVQALLTFLAALALVAALVVWAVRQDQKARQIQMPTPELLPLPEEPPPDHF